MALFLVSYDFHAAADEPVRRRLDGWGAVRLLESLWLVTLNNSAVEIRNALKDAGDEHDSIAVVELKAGSDWAGRRINPDGTSWLRRNLDRSPRIVEYPGS